MRRISSREESERISSPSTSREYRVDCLNRISPDASLANSQPEGVSFTVAKDGETIEWQKWKFRVNFDVREGIVLRNVCYDGRPLFYRMALSEMTVPYGDPRAPREFLHPLFVIHGTDCSSHSPPQVRLRLGRVRCRSDCQQPRAGMRLPRCHPLYVLFQSVLPSSHTDLFTAQTSMDSRRTRLGIPSSSRTPSVSTSRTPVSRGSTPTSVPDAQMSPVPESSSSSSSSPLATTSISCAGSSTPLRRSTTRLARRGSCPSLPSTWMRM
jgi:hypothetical protein